jgi:hypothetical protein
MRKVRAVLEEQPLYFDGEPSTASEVQRRLLHPIVSDDWEFRALVDEPEVLERAWRRSCEAPPWAGVRCASSRSQRQSIREA